MSMKLVEGLKAVNGLAPSADLYNGDPATDVVFLKNYDRVLFAIFGVATTGTAVVTVEECDNATPSTSTAIAFTYYSNTSADSGDTFSAATSATASGFTTATSATYIYLIEVKAHALTDGFPAVRLVLTEGVDAAVVGSVMAFAGDARFPGSPDQMKTAIA